MQTVPTAERLCCVAPIGGHAKQHFHLRKHQNTLNPPKIQTYLHCIELSMGGGGKGTWFIAC